MKDANILVQMGVLGGLGLFGMGRGLGMEG